MLNELENLALGKAPAIAIPDLALNLLIGLVLAIIIQWHFKKFGSTLSNKQEFSKVLTPLLLTTVLVISVVKSSLALSLGLVGALSIVRFRTPIKEPEELVYLFLAIGVGLGLGANQAVITVFSTGVILLTTAFFRRREVTYASNDVFLSVGVTDQSNSLDAIHKIITTHVESGNLRRIDVTNSDTEVCYVVSIKEFGLLSRITEELKERFPDARVSFIDQRNLPRI